MSNVAQLESRRARMRTAALEGADQEAIETLWDRIVAAKKQNKPEKVEKLREERAKLIEARDAQIIPLNAEIAEAKKAERRAAREADRKQCEGFSDTELEGLITETANKLAGTRRSLKALVAERDLRAEKAEVARLVKSLPSTHLDILKAHLAN